MAALRERACAPRGAGTEGEVSSRAVRLSDVDERGGCNAGDAAAAYSRSQPAGTQPGELRSAGDDKDVRSLWRLQHERYHESLSTYVLIFSHRSERSSARRCSSLSALADAAAVYSRSVFSSFLCASVFIPLYATR